MSDIFTLTKHDIDEEEDMERKINLDDLFEKKRSKNIDELKLFNKVLARIHNKILLTSKQKVEEQFIWYIIPEFILGCSKYKQSDCIVYVIDKLQENKFMVKYYHPSLLYIYWGHWCPRYIRDKVKSKLGFQIDEYGRKIINDGDDIPMSNQPISNKKVVSNKGGGGGGGGGDTSTSNKKYTNINTYNPTGNLTYNKIIMEMESQKERDDYNDI